MSDTAKVESQSSIEPHPDQVQMGDTVESRSSIEPHPDQVQMVDTAKVESQSSIESHPDQVYDFFQSLLTQLTEIVPISFHDAKVVDGNLQYELFVFGEKITVKFKAEQIDPTARSITFTVLHENKNKKNTALMIKLTVNDGNITWSLQFVDSNDVSDDVSRNVKAVIDLVIKAMDVYLQFSALQTN